MTRIKMGKIENPRIISFKLLPSEIYLWKNYSINIGISPSNFLISKVNRFLSLKPLKEDFDSEKTIEEVKKSHKYKQLLKIGKNKNKVSVSLRLGKETLKEWDDYGKERFFSRTTLIRQILDRFFKNKPDRLSLIIGSLICEVGSIDFQRLIEIFDNKVDPSTLMQVLNRLEEKGTITRKRWDNYGQTMNLEGEPNEIVRKGWDLYVPNNPVAKSSEMTSLGELLTHFI